MSNAAKLNVTGIVVTAAGMLLQIVPGSELYPTSAGPIALLAVAVIVAFVRRGWTAYVGLLVPLVLGVGAIIAADDERLHRAADRHWKGGHLCRKRHACGRSSGRGRGWDAASPAGRE